jgi:sugar phosphate permease
MCNTVTRKSSYFSPGALLQRFPVGRVLGANIFLWGTVTCCTAVVKTSRQIIALRTVLGCFECVTTPALIMITSSWWKKAEGASRFGFWYCGLGVGQILGGLICFAVQHSTSTNFQGWRIMFLCVGAVNLVVAIVIFCWLPSNPESAKFLSPAEKEVIAKLLHDDHSGVGIKIMRPRSVLETLLDLQTWLLCLLTILNVMPSGVITTYSSRLIRDFGFDSKQAALLNMPSGLVSIAAIMGSTSVISKGYQRWVAIIFALLVTLLGACLMSFSPNSNQAALLAGIYLLNFVSLFYSIVYSFFGTKFDPFSGCGTIRPHP